VAWEDPPTLSILPYLSPDTGAILKEAGIKDITFFWIILGYYGNLDRRTHIFVEVENCIQVFCLATGTGEIITADAPRSVASILR